MSQTKKGRKTHKHNNNKNKTRRRSSSSSSSSSFVKLQCSPMNQPTATPYTCFSHADMLNLRHVWNIRHPDNKIHSTNRKDIWEHIKTQYANVCNKESCWVRQLVMTSGSGNRNKQQLKAELLDAFAPESPKEWIKNPNEWLSSVDITNVMRQYEQAYKCFDFIGPSPIDFDTVFSNGKCVWNELCRFSLASHLKQGHFKIGIIFNLDKHNQPGSHWVSLFINVKKHMIFYFDSVGDKAPPEVVRFVKKVAKQGKQLNPPVRFIFDENHPVEHQNQNTECGIYSLFFIIHMLQDKITGHYLKTHVLKDKFMERFRRIMYNKYKHVSSG